MNIHFLLSLNAVSIKSLLDPLLRPVAYLDPGSGSYLIQILIAFLLGSAIAIRAFWGRIKAFFKKSATDSVIEQEDDE
jgi:hypothetical protein